MRSDEKRDGAAHVRLAVRGMTCAACVGRVEKTLRAAPGVLEADVFLVDESATVVFDPRVASTASLAATIEAAGYHATVERPTPDATEVESHTLAIEAVRAAVLGIPLVASGMAHGVAALAGAEARAVQWVLATLVLLGPGRRFFALAWTAARHRAADMNTLVALGAAAAYGWSVAVILLPSLTPHAAHGAMPHVYFEAVGAIIGFLSFGKWLEARARVRLSDAVRGLVALQPSVAHRVVDSRLDDAPVAAIAVHDHLIVRPGERVPLDGVVIEGTSCIDESLLTGESVPVEKVAGDAVTAGTMNGRGAITVRVTRVGSDTTLARIVEAVREAQGSKAPIAKLADRVSGVFVPIVLGIAATTFVVWAVIDPSAAGLAVAVERAVAVLVIACPCALGLATPAAIAVAVGRGAELGVLVRGGQSLEAASRVDVVLFDKTGTLTEGHPEVVEVRTFGIEERRALALVGALETRSEHPLASAIVRAARLGGIAMEVRAFRAEPGRGVEGIVDGRLVRAGTERWLRDADVDLHEHAASLTAMARAGRTPVLVAIDGVLAAILGVADRTLVEARDVVHELQQSGVHVAIVTGDREEVAHALAAELGVREIHAGVRPEGKARIVAEAKARGKIVAMVGDGVNDAPALASADVGIAIGSGADVAVAASDIALIRRGIASLPLALALSRATLRTIRQNLFWAFVYNVVGIPLAAGLLVPWTGLSLSPVVASAAMSLSSVSVLLSSLRLRSFGRTAHADSTRASVMNADAVRQLS